MFDIEIDRRGFALGSLVAGIFPLSTRAGASGRNGPDTQGGGNRLHKLLVDRNIPESVRLGAYAGGIADEVFVFDGDLTQLWSEELRSQWPKGPRPIAGLTAPGVPFVLEQLGRDHDARIVFSAEHRMTAECIQHSLLGCASLLHTPEGSGRPDWVADMARHIIACPLQPPSRRASLEYETALGAGLQRGRNRLVTWVLAPITPRNQHSTSVKAS